MKAAEYRRSVTPNWTWLSKQGKDCQQYAQEHGMTIIATYADVGRSRYGLRTLLEASTRGEFAAVIVADTARLGRAPGDHLRTLERLRDAGVEVHIAKQPTTSSGFSLVVSAVLAYAEADDQRLDALSRSLRS